MVTVPACAVFALFAFVEVAAVDVRRGGAGCVAAEVADAVVEVVAVGVVGGAGFFDPLAALAEGVVAEFGGFVGTCAPGDFYEAVLEVPFVAAGAVAEQVAVGIEGGGGDGGGG